MSTDRNKGFLPSGSASFALQGGVSERQLEGEALPSRSRRLYETLGVAFLLVLVNALVAVSGSLSEWIFMPGSVAGGEWWRLLSGPLVHVSWYHLLLDGAAFLLLLTQLRNERAAVRWAYVVSAALASMAFALALSPAIWERGLCGLSGAAHGLMAITALEMIRKDDGLGRRYGWIALGLVISKSVIEALSGQVLFSWLHFGLVGDPVAICHLGGVLGGMVAFAVLEGRGCHERIQATATA